MFKKILLCTDLSEASEYFTACVGQLKTLGVEEVILAHIIYVAAIPDLDKTLAREAAPLLEQEKKKLEDAGLAVTTEMFLGKPAYALDSLAEKHDVSLVVIGSHGKGFLYSLVLGSVSEKLLQLTRRPMLLARNKILRDEKECLTRCSKLFEHILFPTDFSDASEMAFGCLEQMVARTRAVVTLLTVRPKNNDPFLDDKLCRIDIARLNRMKKRLEEKGASTVHSSRASGEAAEEILAACRENTCSLIVMGTHGRGVLGEVALGSCAHEVARKAQTPILYASSIVCSCM